MNNSLNLEAENRGNGDLDSSHVPETIIINDDDKKIEGVDETHLEAPEESDKTKMGRNFIFLNLMELIMTY